MSPLDDELRALLSNRAHAVAPSADPIAGIERRARGIHRKRVAASLTGSALVVAVLAAAVPTLAGSLASREEPLVPASPTATPGPVPPPTLSASPSASPTPAAEDAYVLDPEDPWPYRGDPEVIAQGSRETFTREWAHKHGLAPELVRWDPLFGQVYEPSQQAEVAYVATDLRSGQPWFGVVTATESGPEFGPDSTLNKQTRAVMIPLRGDEAARLLVIAHPKVGQLEYAADGKRFAPMAEPVKGTAGVGVTALEGDTTRDLVRVLDGNGDTDNPVFLGPAPDYASEFPGPPPAESGPENLVGWPTRGTVSGKDSDAALAAYARAVGAELSDVRSHLLFGSGDDTGRRFLLMQAWVVGEKAHTFGFSTGGGREDEPFLGTVTDIQPGVLAMLVSSGPGQTTDTLVVVPEPGQTEVRYSPDGDAPAQRKGESQDYLEGVVLIDRDPRASEDRLHVVRRDGNARTLYDGPVSNLLCGLKSCS